MWTTFGSISTNTGVNLRKIPSKGRRGAAIPLGYWSNAPPLYGKYHSRSHVAKKETACYTVDDSWFCTGTAFCHRFKGTKVTRLPTLSEISFFQLSVVVAIHQVYCRAHEDDARSSTALCVSDKASIFTSLGGIRMLM
ncbi:hypothetical protein PsorP6_012768 [Peronosclerospora sorghi]|uniref:Uncharacterized protein n=1 Tax=Peronosclerospora sorghi TaxID=230839 RepID=A0ACC0WHV3_9STRA|nr:hypothetical protein PsorP6_012768 [Peronosclerospora sorghi]